MNAFTLKNLYRNIHGMFAHLLQAAEVSMVSDVFQIESLNILVIERKSAVKQMLLSFPIAFYCVKPILPGKELYIKYRLYNLSSRAFII